MPKNKKKHRIAQRFVDPSVREMVAVFMHGQPFYTKPLCYITKEQSKQWRAEGSGETYDRGRIFELSKPTSDRLMTGNSALGTCLIWASFRDDREIQAKIALLRLSAIPSGRALRSLEFLPYRAGAEHTRIAAA